MFKCIVEIEEKTGCTREKIEDIIQKQLNMIYVNPNINLNSDLSKFSFGDICRYATSSDEARKHIYSKLKLRPLPLKKPYELYPHQEQTLQFMKRIESGGREKLRGETGSYKGGIVSLKMGMGKTLSALTHMITAPKGEYPTLIVVSKTIVNVWVEEGINKFFTDIYKPKVFIFTKAHCKNYEYITPLDFKNYDIVITTYSTLTSITKKVPLVIEEIKEMGDEHTLMNGRVEYLKIRDKRFIVGKQDETFGGASIYYTPWERIVCDEAHVFTNPDTETYKSVLALVSQNRWCLTGTPFRNDYEDIYSLLRFSGWDNANVRSANLFKRLDSSEIREICARYILSIGYKEADIKLPPTHEIVHRVKFEDTNEKAYYKWIFSFLKKTIEDLEDAPTPEERRGIWGFVLALFTHLRQASVASYLTHESVKIRERMSIRRPELVEWLNNRSGTAGMRSLKLRKIVDIAKTIPVKDKFIIFSTFSSALHMLFELFEEHMPELGCVLVDGENAGRRDTIVDSFKKDKDVRCLLITYHIGSEGLNLTEANHCIFVDPWWADTVHQQARARIVRTGQKKETYVHHIEIEDTIEQRVLETCRRKNALEAAALGDTFQKVEKGISLNLMKDLLR